MPHSMPFVLGSWELVAPIAHGSRTVLYRARPAGANRDLPCDYVVKTLSADAGPAAVRFLQREAIAAQTVSHAHIIPVLSSHVRHRPPWLVLPFLPGIDLGRLLSRRVTLPIGEAVWIGRQVAEALVVLHGAGWLHGDVKPENIMVSPQGHVTLIDLGFARRLATPECAAETPLLGTPAFAAPERLHQTAPATASSDVYSLGMTMAQMIGQRPNALRHGAEPQRPEDRALVRLLGEMLQDAPERRPTATAVRDRLTGLELELLCGSQAIPIGPTATSAPAAIAFPGSPH